MSIYWALLDWGVFVYIYSTDILDCCFTTRLFLYTATVSVKYLFYLLILFKVLNLFNFILVFLTKQAYSSWQIIMPF